MYVMMRALGMFLLCALKMRGALGQQYRPTGQTFSIPNASMTNSVGFLHSSDPGSPSGWTYSRHMGVSNDMFGQTAQPSCPNGLYGYAGGTLNGYRAIPNRDVVLQRAGGNQQQSMEFYFCQPVVVRQVKMQAPHAGHNLLRGTLERRDSSGWTAVGNGHLFEENCFISNQANRYCNHLNMQSVESVCSSRWRVADFRTQNDQWLSGTFVTYETCEEGAPINLGDLNGTLHGRIDGALDAIRQANSTTTAQITTLATALADTETTIIAAVQSINTTVTGHTGDIAVATEERNLLSARLTAVEQNLTQLISLVGNMSQDLSTLLAPLNVRDRTSGGCGNSCSPAIHSSAGGETSITGSEVSLESRDCTTTGADLCALRNTVDAVVRRFNT